MFTEKEIRALGNDKICGKRILRIICRTQFPGILQTDQIWWARICVWDCSMALPHVST